MKNDIDSYVLPLTKNGEQYFLLKKEDNNRVSYYIITVNSAVIGHFYIGIYKGNCNITYEINEEYQNRGIGQITLKFVVQDIFNFYNVDRIVLLPTNPKSKIIALKCGFEPIRRGVYELNNPMTLGKRI